jgi:enoyl-CoA hydratase/carnithine racemase
MAGWSPTVFARELPPRSAGFNAENRLYSFALTMPSGSPRRAPASARPSRAPWETVCRSATSRGSNALSGWALHAEPLDASEARACGFVLTVVETRELPAKADTVVARLTANAPLTIAATRKSMRRLGEAAAPDGDDVIAEVHGSRDFREGVSSFLEERAARWSGA